MKEKDSDIHCRFVCSFFFFAPRTLMFVLFFFLICQKQKLLKTVTLIIRKEYTLKSAKGGNRKGKVREASKQEFYIMLRMCHPPNIICDSILEVVPIC